MNTNALEVKINAVQILKNLARNLDITFYEYVEDVAKVCIEQLIDDPYAQTVRKESAKCMRFLIAACREHPERQKALFIITYAKLMVELEKRKVKKEFDLVNVILKEVFKQLKLFFHFKQKNMTVFTLEDAQNFTNKLLEISNLIKVDRVERMKKVQAMSKHIDEEDMEYFYEDLASLQKCNHHIMEINGFLMQNMGDQISAHIATTLLPEFAQVLLNIQERKTDELIDSVCFICDCMEHGTIEMFNQIHG